MSRAGHSKEGRWRKARGSEEAIHPALRSCDGSGSQKALHFSEIITGQQCVTIRKENAQNPETLQKQEF